jgi:hypothetical protein
MCRYIGDALKVNQTLQHLNLGYNNIGDEGCQYIGDALKVNQTLQHLNLGYNKICDEGCQYIGDALKVNQTLQHLNLGYNVIGDEGCQYIGDALKVNQTLQYLDLNNNKDGQNFDFDIIDTNVKANIISILLQKNQLLAESRSQNTSSTVLYTLSQLQSKYQHLSNDQEPSSLLSITKRTNYLLQSTKRILQTPFNLQQCLSSISSCPVQTTTYDEFTCKWCEIQSITHQLSSKVRSWMSSGQTFEDMNHEQISKLLKQQEQRKQLCQFIIDTRTSMQQQLTNKQQQIIQRTQDYEQIIQLASQLYHTCFGKQHTCSDIYINGCNSSFIYISFRFFCSLFFFFYYSFVILLQQMCNYQSMNKLYHCLLLYLLFPHH